MQNAKEAMQQADDWLGVPQVRRMTEMSFKDVAAGGVGLGVHATPR